MHWLTECDTADSHLAKWQLRRSWTPGCVGAASYGLCHNVEQKLSLSAQQRCRLLHGKLVNYIEGGLAGVAILGAKWQMQ